MPLFEYECPCCQHKTDLLCSYDNRPRTVSCSRCEETAYFQFSPTAKLRINWSAWWHDWALDDETIMGSDYDPQHTRDDILTDENLHDLESDPEFNELVEGTQRKLQEEEELGND